MAKKSSNLDVFSPSEYTGMINLFLHKNKDKVLNKRVCEIGTGNGIIAAYAAMIGAASITVSDVEEEALSAAKKCIGSIKGAIEKTVFLHGGLWEPFDNQSFDLILANLPHFPCENLTLTGRLPSWSSGGLDGRDLLGPFIEGIARHLKPTGLAVFTHNKFSDLEKTRIHLTNSNLKMSYTNETLIHLPVEKAKALTLGVSNYGDNIMTVGKYSFGHAVLVLASWSKRK